MKNNLEELSKKFVYLHEYMVSKEIATQDYPFYALIMAAMRQADSNNIQKLRYLFPDVYDELKELYYIGGIPPLQEVNK